MAATEQPEGYYYERAVNASANASPSVQSDRAPVALSGGSSAPCASDEAPRPQPHAGWSRSWTRASYASASRSTSIAASATRSATDRNSPNCATPFETVTSAHLEHVKRRTFFLPPAGLGFVPSAALRAWL